MEGNFYSITGAGSGIGRATAIRCAELGASGVTLCDLSTEGLEVTKEMMYSSHHNIKVVLITEQRRKIPNESPHPDSRHSQSRPGGCLD